MSGYDIFLSDGNLLTTINVKTVDTQEHTALYLIGQGIPNYGTMVAQDLVWMLENFSNATPPVNPLIGMLWYDNVHGRENFYNGSAWVSLLASKQSLAESFVMLPAAGSIDFTAAATTTIFTGVGGTNYYPMTVVLLPVGSITATTSPVFNVYASSAGDVLPTTTVATVGNQTFAHYTTTANSKYLSGSQSLYLQITTAATGGLARYAILVFGLLQ